MNPGLDADPYVAQRHRMVRSQIEARDVHNPAVLRAMRDVPRHLFVTEDIRGEAYGDGPLEIGHGQTISQPYIVASMTEHLAVGAGSRVLEIGTGCGYQTAILVSLGCELFSVEIIADLQRQAADLLARLGYKGVSFRCGDGFEGWPEHAPYDGILVAAAAPRLPESYASQLRVGGRIVIPIEERGTGRQCLYLFEKHETALEKRLLYDVRFVRMTGAVGR